MTVGLSEDFSSGDPVLLGSVWVTPLLEAPHGVVRPARTTWSWQTPGQESLPTPPAMGEGDERAATRLFSWEGVPVAQVPDFVERVNRAPC